VFAFATPLIVALSAWRSKVKRSSAGKIRRIVSPLPSEAGGDKVNVHVENWQISVGVNVGCTPTVAELLSTLEAVFVVPKLYVALFSG